MGSLEDCIPQNVIEDIESYKAEVSKFIAGEIPPDVFKPISAAMGIYEQRESGTYMLRVRLAAGILRQHQADCVADLAQRFGSGSIHLTTRQDLQIHRIMMPDIPAVLDGLLAAGLASRGGGGNGPRNVAACPYAGVCADEAFDVTPYAQALTDYLLRNPQNFHLPRKFKAAFSGCSKDCALCSAADLGFFAHIKDGIPGFSVYAAGGMGARSSLSIKLEDFIPADAVFDVAEAVIRLFDKHGDRANRSRARLRFVLERVGQDEFIRLYKEELDKVRKQPKTGAAIGVLLAAEHSQLQSPSPDLLQSAGPDDPEYQKWVRANVIGQKQPGLAIVRIPLPQGDVRASTLKALAALAESRGEGALRLTKDQELQIRSVQLSDLPAVYSDLNEIDRRLTQQIKLDIASCTGASTCRLGIRFSRGLVEALRNELQGLELPFVPQIRISGCVNACGHHPIAPLGLFGTAVNVDGRRVPAYYILTGGRAVEGDARFAEPLVRVPARNVPTLLKEFLSAAGENVKQGETWHELMERWGRECISKLAEKYQQLPPYEDAPDMYEDFEYRDQSV